MPHGQTFFLTFTTCKGSTTTVTQTARRRLSEVVELTEVTQQWMVSRDPDSRKILPGCCDRTSLWGTAGLPAAFCSTQSQPAWASGMLGHHVTCLPWEVGQNLCHQHLRVLPTKCRPSMFQLTAHCQGQWEWHQVDSVT